MYGFEDDKIDVWYMNCYMQEAWEVWNDSSECMNAW